MLHKPLGALRNNITPDVVMMLCTAGHVDHGKTSLVKLLTGCNTDRLKIEQERGMSIELGFAPCFLGGNLCVGIVDVPGHEKFIKNMVAGVSGIDMTILVIAADDGVMPQTVEHIQIMELLGVKKGIIALTKTDLVSKERLDSVKSEIKEYIKGTFLSGAEILPVSSETFEGYPEFYDRLVSIINDISVIRQRGIFRMPIERTFIRQGFGVVVAGIPVSGEIKIGDEVEILPGGQRGKIKGIQRFLREAESGKCGQCLAVNIPDFNKIDPQRGQIIAAPGYIKPASMFHLKIKAVSPLEHTLKNAEQIKFHSGTCEKIGKIYLPEEKILKAGCSAVATVVLAEPVAIAAGDRCIIRRASPSETVAGGEIIFVSQEAQRPQRTAILKQMNDYLTFLGSAEKGSAEYKARQVEHLLCENPKGLSVEEIAKSLLFDNTETTQIMEKLLSDEKILKLENLYFSRSTLDSLVERVSQFLSNLSAGSGALSISLIEFRKAFNITGVLQDYIDRKLNENKIAQKNESKYILHQGAASFESGEERLIESVYDIYFESGFSTPRPDEASERLKISTEKCERIIEHLCNSGKLLRLSKNVILAKEFFLQAQNSVIKIIKEKGILDSADFKYTINSSRKYALAILDFLDLKGITMRIDNNRKLARDYEKKIIR